MYVLCALLGVAEQSTLALQTNIVPNLAFLLEKFWDFLMEALNQEVGGGVEIRDIYTYIHIHM